MGPLDRPRCELVQGEPREIVDGRLGQVALFGPGEFVAYRLQGRRRSRLFVFRTVDVPDPLAASVPGVRPRVHLLLSLHSAGRVRLVRKLFAYLARQGQTPSELPDAFYLRVGTVLGGRLPRHKVLFSLLSRPGLGISEV
jgi:hypothetical protein